MSKYVMSDIHGDFNRFIEMLNKINFSKEDTLYIIGDIVDRGDEPYKILEYIISNKNIHLLKGNHEMMFEEFYESGDASLWFYNGGQKTYEDFIKRGYDVYDSIYKYIKNLPFIKVVDNFILVHGGIIITEENKDLDIDSFIKTQEEDDCLWDRDFIKNDKKFKDYTVICGHTPVQYFTDRKNNTILKRDNVIMIDCGCGTSYSDKKLGCLRLDDLEEFYV